MVDSLCSLTINSIRDLSYWVLHLFLSSFQRITRSTESYAFWRSMSRLNFLFLRPWTSFNSRLACMAVDLPSFKPVWYILEEMRWGYWVLIHSKMAFSMILEICECTTMGLISSRPQGALVNVIYNGTSLPTLK
jgi:hypothetical protein